MKKKLLIINFLFLIIGTIIATYFGLKLDKQNFLLNILANLPIAALGVWISVEIVEKIINDKEARDWAVVQNNVRRQIIKLLIDTSVIYIDYVPPFLSDYVNLLKESRSSELERAEIIRKLYQDYLSNPDNESRENVQQLYRSVEYKFSRLMDLTQIYTTLPGKQQGLIEHLQNLEESIFDWERIMQKDQDKKICGSELKQKAAKVLPQISNLISFESSMNKR